jgi:hypothetical protein
LRSSDETDGAISISWTGKAFTLLTVSLKLEGSVETTVQVMVFSVDRSTEGVSASPDVGGKVIVTAGRFFSLIVDMAQSRTTSYQRLRLQRPGKG